MMNTNIQYDEYDDTVMEFFGHLHFENFFLLNPLESYRAIINLLINKGTFSREMFMK
jgi:hypothetical protein